MTNKDLREQIQEMIHDFSSKERQYEAWFVCKRIISSPDEDYCMFFDDLGIESYVNFNDNYFTKKENQELKKFINSLNEYGNKHRDLKGFLDLDAEIVYNDPEWEKIREQAKCLYDLLAQEEGLEELTLIKNWTK